jgi:D-alanine-D-alanine ligase
MKIAVLMGGTSNEREISLISGSKVAKTLKALEHEVIKIDVNEELVDKLKLFNPDVVFNAVHGKFGEDGCIQGFLNLLNIPYTNSGVRASAIAMHKPTAKRFFEALKIPTPKWSVVKSKELPFQKIPFNSYVLKPSSEGSSIGVQIIDSGKIDLDKLNKYDEIIIEEFIPGKELSVATLNGISLGVIQITSQQKFHDYDSKYVNTNTKYTIPANIRKQRYDEAMSISEKLYKNLDCRGIIRVDFRYNDKLDELYALEVNTHPGLTLSSMAPKIAEYAGITYDELIENLISHAKCDL